MREDATDRAYIGPSRPVAAGRRVAADMVQQAPLRLRQRGPAPPARLPARVSRSRPRVGCAACGSRGRHRRPHKLCARERVRGGPPSSRGGGALAGSDRRAGKPRPLPARDRSKAALRTTISAVPARGSAGARGRGSSRPLPAGQAARPRRLHRALKRRSATALRVFRLAGPGRSSRRCARSSRTRRLHAALR